MVSEGTKTTHQYMRNAHRSGVTDWVSTVMEGLCTDSGFILVDDAEKTWERYARVLDSIFAVSYMLGGKP